MPRRHASAGIPLLVFALLALTGLVARVALPLSAAASPRQSGAFAAMETLGAALCHDSGTSPGTPDQDHALACEACAMCQAGKIGPFALAFSPAAPLFWARGDTPVMAAATGATAMAPPDRANPARAPPAA